jgi:hypothetical protein
VCGAVSKTTPRPLKLVFEPKRDTFASVGSFGRGESGGGADTEMSLGEGDIVIAVGLLSCRVLVHQLTHFHPVRSGNEQTFVNQNANPLPPFASRFFLPSASISVTVVGP